MTWGIKIAEFLVEMELFPQIRNQMGSNSLIHSWLIISPREQCMINIKCSYDIAAEVTANDLEIK